MKSLGLLLAFVIISCINESTNAGDNTTKPTNSPLNDENIGNTTDLPITTASPIPTTILPTTTSPTTPNTTIITTSTETPTTGTPSVQSSTQEPTKGGATRRFDAPSFIGGIVLSLGLLAIVYVGFKFFKERTEQNYHTL